MVCGAVCRRAPDHAEACEFACDLALLPGPGCAHCFLLPWGSIKPSTRARYDLHSARFKKFCGTLRVRLRGPRQLVRVFKTQGRGLWASQLSVAKYKNAGALLRQGTAAFSGGLHQGRRKAQPRPAHRLPGPPAQTPPTAKQYGNWAIWELKCAQGPRWPEHLQCSWC